MLIIGILAAIALPQYQSSVVKSGYTKLIILTKAIDLRERFFLRQGSYATGFTLLDIGLPPGGTTVNGIINMPGF